MTVRKQRSRRVLHPVSFEPTASKKLVLGLPRARDALFLPLRHRGLLNAYPIKRFERLSSGSLRLVVGDEFFVGHGSSEYRHPDKEVNRQPDTTHWEYIGVPIQGLDSFRLRLRYAREELRKMKQVPLAKAAGITQPSLSELENGETKEVSGPTLIGLARALRVRPEWLMTGEEPIEAAAVPSLRSDERELIDDYRASTGRWKSAIRYMAKLRGDQLQDEAAESMSVIFAKIAAPPVPDSRLGDKWTRPDKKPGT